MGEWKEYKISDLVSINQKSISKNFEFDEIEYLDTGSITMGKIESYQRIKFIDSPSRAKRLLKANDIVYSTVRPIQRHYGLLRNPKPNTVVSTGFAVITCNEELADPNFIYYFLTQDDIVNYLDSVAEGSTSAYPSLTPDVITNLELFAPDLSEQKSIASILSSLDDKIDLLHRQNKTLEALAETLFRQWFVEEADESWETRKLFDIADVQNGYAFKSSDYVSFQEGFLEVLKMGHIERGGGLRSNPKRDYIPRNDKLKRWILNTNDIVMAMTDMKDNVVILGVPAMIDKDDNYVLNQRVARISLKRNSELNNKYLLYVQLKDPEFIAILQSKSNSGVQVNLSIEVIKDCDIIVPPLEVQKEKGIVITNLYLKKEKNQIQIRTLTQLRDTLLPKLMSGEVRTIVN